MQEGDLIYIPQDVSLWASYENGTKNIIKTIKPITGVFLGLDGFDTSKIYALGRQATVLNRCIYPIAEDNKCL
tara:strand:- start:203 stop:421 length:219 start_codon:yes stop_codon:yes gene_type:complete